MSKTLPSLASPEDENHDPRGIKSVRRRVIVSRDLGVLCLQPVQRRLLGYQLLRLREFLRVALQVRQRRLPLYSGL